MSAPPHPRRTDDVRAVAYSGGHPLAVRSSAPADRIARRARQAAAGAQTGAHAHRRRHRRDELRRRAEPASEHRRRGRDARGHRAGPGLDVAAQRAGRPDLSRASSTRSSTRSARSSSSSDPGMCYRAGWIFVSSPNTVTPFHMDHEHNFILQIRGTKRCTSGIRSIAPSSRSGPRRCSTTRTRASSSAGTRTGAHARHVFDLKPGDGGYMPSTAPHLVESRAGAVGHDQLHLLHRLDPPA